MDWTKSRKIGCFLAGYGLLAVLFHVFWLKLGGGDDYYFMTCLNDIGYWSFLEKRWNGWSSRIVIEGVLIWVLQQPVTVWRILDILVSILVAVLMLGFIFYKKKQNEALLAAWMFLLLISYDFRELSSAGWMTTTINYWWALAAAMLAFLPLRFSGLKGRPCKRIYLFSIPAAVFAINHEQICIIGICTCIYLFLREWLQTRRVHWYIFLLFGICVLNMAGILLCPGNTVRKLSNIAYWFPRYADFNILQKGLLGWYSLLMALYKDINWTWFLFTGILFVTVVWKRKRFAELLIAGIPFASNVGLLGITILSKFGNYHMIGQILYVFDFDRPIVYYQGFLPNKIRLLLLIYTVCCFCVAGSLFLLFVEEDVKKTADLLAILVIGAVSKVSMGMSPTVWASSERTSVFLNFSFIFLGMACGEEALKWIRKEQG